MKFRSAAHTYDTYATVQNTLFEHLKTRLSPTLPSLKTLVDLGCATGKHTAELADAFPHLSITGIDIENEMISYATTHHHRKNITFIPTSIDHYLPSSTDDVIISNATFQWLPNPTQTLTQIRQLRPKQILFSVFAEDTFSELKTCLSDIFNTPITLAVDRFLTGSDWISLLRSLFPHVHVEQYHLCETYPDSASLLRHIAKTGATQSFPYRTVWTPSLLKKLDQSFYTHYGMIKSTYHAYLFDLS